MNLRPAVTALSPLAERMHEDGLSRATIGALTTIPLILFGLAGMSASWIGSRIGLARTLGLGLVILGLGCLLRSAPGDLATVWRFGGTVLIGAGIALGNVLLPGLVKSRYPNHLGQLTALYSTAMNLGAALGIAFAVPFAMSLPGDWNSSLAIWGLWALIAFVVWAPQLKPKPTVKPVRHPLSGVACLARKPRAWQVAAYMGLQSTTFYASVAWLPTVLQYRGMSELQAAGWVSSMQFLGCAASLIVPALAGRTRSQSPWTVGCAILCGLSLLGILVLPLSLAGFAVLTLGLAVNAAFGVALLIIAMRSQNQETAAALSSLAQSAGYLLAAPTPWIVGMVSSLAGWNVAYGLVIGLTVLVGIFGFLAGRPGELSLDPDALEETDLPAPQESYT